MSAAVVAERYAQALFELGLESGQLGQLASKFGEFAAALSESRELSATLNDPTRDEEERLKVLQAVARRVGVPDIGIKGLSVMAQRQRLAAVPETAARLTELCDEKDGVLRASVTTATKMPEGYYQSLIAKLQAATGKKIVLER